MKLSLGNDAKSIVTPQSFLQSCWLSATYTLQVSRGPGTPRTHQTHQVFAIAIAIDAMQLSLTLPFSVFPTFDHLSLTNYISS